MNKVKERELKKIISAASELKEYFDTVQIFVTKHTDSKDEDCTEGMFYGNGNKFTIYGQIIDWVNNYRAIQSGEGGYEAEEGQDS